MSFLYNSGMWQASSWAVNKKGQLIEIAVLVGALSTLQLFTVLAQATLVLRSQIWQVIPPGMGLFPINLWRAMVTNMASYPAWYGFVSIQYVDSYDGTKFVYTLTVH